MVLQGVALAQQPGVSTPVASSTKHVAAGHAGAAHCAPAVDALAKSRAPTKPRTPTMHRFPAVMSVPLPWARFRAPRPAKLAPAFLPCQGKIACDSKRDEALVTRQPRGIVPEGGRCTSSPPHSMEYGANSTTDEEGEGRWRK